MLITASPLIKVLIPMVVCMVAGGLGVLKYFKEFSKDDSWENSPTDNRYINGTAFPFRQCRNAYEALKAAKENAPV